MGNGDRGQGVDESDRYGAFLMGTEDGREQVKSNIRSGVGKRYTPAQADKLYRLIDSGADYNTVNSALKTAQQAFREVPQGPGLGGAFVRGAAGMPGLPGDIETAGRFAITQNPNAWTQTPYPTPTPESPAFMPTSAETIEATERFTGMELPPSVTGGERIMETAGAGLVGGAPGIGRKMAVAGMQKGMKGAVASFIRSSTANLTGGVVAGTGAEAGRAVGGDGAAPLIGSLIFSLGGSASVYGFKRLIRPGTEKRQAMEELVALFDENIGGEQSLGAAAGGRMARLEQTLASIPGATGRLHAKGREFSRNAQKRLVTLLGRELDDVTPAELGGGVIYRALGKRVDQTRRNGERLYRAARNLVGDPTRGVSWTYTRSTLRELASQKRKIRQGAREAVRAGAPGPEQRAAELLEELTKGYGQGIPYDKLDDLRQTVGAQLNDAAIGDEMQGMLRKVYASLSDDLSDGAQLLGGKRAQLAVTKAKTFWTREKALADRVLTPLKRKAPEIERVFDDVLNDRLTKTTKMRELFSQMTQAEKKVVAQSWVHKLGKLADDGSVQPDWNPETFINNWNKASATGRKIIMEGNPGLNQDLNRLIKAVGAQVGTRSNIMQPGATAGTGLTAASIWYAMAGLTAAGIGYGLGGDENKGMVSSVAGTAGLLTAMAAPNIGARLMTSPVFVKWAADTTTSAMSIPKQMARLNAIMQNSDDAQLIQDMDTFVTYLSVAAGDDSQIVEDSPIGTTRRSVQ